MFSSGFHPIMFYPRANTGGSSSSVSGPSTDGLMIEINYQYIFKTEIELPF